MTQSRCSTTWPQGRVRVKSTKRALTSQSAATTPSGIHFRVDPAATHGQGTWSVIHTSSQPDDKDGDPPNVNTLFPIAFIRVCTRRDHRDRCPFSLAVWGQPHPIQSHLVFGKCLYWPESKHPFSNALYCILSGISGIPCARSGRIAILFGLSGFRNFVH
ncbi:MAG: hypothetical protein J3Q66DRAFT_81495 [Benniella sp.]|nr:MAG: hypothetical protein J3Q66DRAFT_81495 [Benniella sp.]